MFSTWNWEPTLRHQPTSQGELPPAIATPMHAKAARFRSTKSWRWLIAGYPRPRLPNLVLQHGLRRPLQARSTNYFKFIYTVIRANREMSGACGSGAHLDPLTTHMHFYKSITTT